MIWYIVYSVYIRMYSTLVMNFHMDGFSAELTTDKDEQSLASLPLGTTADAAFFRHVSLVHTRCCINTVVVLARSALLTSLLGRAVELQV